MNISCQLGSGEIGKEFVPQDCLTSWPLFLQLREILAAPAVILCP